MELKEVIERVESVLDILEMNEKPLVYATPKMRAAQEEDQRDAAAFQFTIDTLQKLERGELFERSKLEEEGYEKVVRCKDCFHSSGKMDAVGDILCDLDNSMNHHGHYCAFGIMRTENQSPPAATHQDGLQKKYEEIMKYDPYGGMV